jgi:hypothetical protein
VADVFYLAAHPFLMAGLLLIRSRTPGPTGPASWTPWSSPSALACSPGVFLVGPLAQAPGLKPGLGVAPGRRGPGVARDRRRRAGFVPGQAADPPGLGHFGLASMRQQVEMAGGVWQLRSRPGRGTTVTATLPMAGAGRAAGPPHRPGPFEPATGGRDGG